MAEGILKGLLVCTACAAALQWPVDLSPPAEGLSLAKEEMEGLRGGRGGGVSDRVSAMGIEDIVDMETDVCRCCARPLLCLYIVAPRVIRVLRVLRVCFYFASEALFPFSAFCKRSSSGLSGWPA